MQKASLFRSLLVTLAVLSAGLVPVIAQAQASVVVLGVRSLEGDDELAHNVSGALRRAASQVQGWTVSDREITLSQMALAHGCEEPDETCLAQMAESLGSSRLIFGDVRRTSTSTAYDWSLTLHLFSAASGRIEQTVTDTIARVRSDIDDLREPARRYAAALSGAPRVGTLRISVNVPGAEVFIDDAAVGVADAQGRLLVPNVEAGSRAIRIAAAGHQGFRSTVSVEPYGEASFEAELQAGGEGGGGGTPAGGGGTPPELYAGIGLLVAAAGLAAGWIGSWATLQGLNGDPDFQQYRADAGEYVRAIYGADAQVSSYDACALGASNRPFFVTDVGYLAEDDVADRAAAVCSQASTMEVLQFVFGIGAAAAAGVGLYFLIAALTADSGEAPAEQSWRLVPSAGPDHGYLGVALSF